MRSACLAIGLVLAPASARAAIDDWVEGTDLMDDGATRDYYNRAGLLSWRSTMGDWADATGTAQGADAYATTTVVDDDASRYVEWDVTALVQAWVDGDLPNKGFFLHATAGGGTFNFRSREHATASERPELVVTASGTDTLSPLADTYLETSTYQCMGDSDTIRISDTNNALLRFDLSAYSPGEVTHATLRILTYEQYGSGSIDIGVFHCDQGHGEPYSDPIPGIAASYDEDVGIAADPAVVFFTDFESSTWQDEWTFTGGNIDTVDSDPDRLFEPLQNRALRSLMAEGENTALNMGFKFMDETGSEPEEIYFRYYLRFGSDWNQTVDGGKMPGISGTYGVAGWGGRPSDGTNGWSARGSFLESIQPENPLRGTTPLGTYCYHADMEGDYGDVWLWQNDYRGYIPNNEWHSVEQYLRMNTPTLNDGVIRAWIDGRLAFEKTDIRFRDVDTLKIEQIWMDIYHGGTDVSPRDQHVYIDNVVVATEYIGPWMDAPVYPDDVEWPELPPDASTDSPSDLPGDGADDGPGGSPGCGCSIVS